MRGDVGKVMFSTKKANSVVVNVINWPQKCYYFSSFKIKIVYTS